MKDRIKEVRKKFHLSQTEFAKKLGFSMSYIAQIEIGAKIPSDRTLQDIAREYNISYEWLKTGDGAMEIQLTKNEILAGFMGEILAENKDNSVLQDFKVRFVTALAQLPIEDWEKLRKFAESLIAENEEETDK